MFADCYKRNSGLFHCSVLTKYINHNSKLSIDRSIGIMFVCLIVDFSNLDFVRRIRPLTFPFQCGREKNQFISLIFLSMSCNFNQGKEIDLNLFYIMWKKKQKRNGKCVSSHNSIVLLPLFCVYISWKNSFFSSLFVAISLRLYFIYNCVATSMFLNTTKRSNTIWTVWRHTIVQSNILSVQGQKGDFDQIYR